MKKLLPLFCLLALTDLRLGKVWIDPDTIIWIAQYDEHHTQVMIDFQDNAYETEESFDSIMNRFIGIGCNHPGRMIR